jgi:hypothetical protein
MSFIKRLQLDGTQGDKYKSPALFYGVFANHRALKSAIASSRVGLEGIVAKKLDAPY